MDSSPRVPHELLREPFTVHQARTAGLTKDMLRSSQWVRVVRGVYRHRDLFPDDDVRVRAIELALPADAVATDLLAAWLLGVWRPPPDTEVPLHWARERGRNRPHAATDLSRRLVLDSSDVVSARGVPCTSAMRTAFGLMRRACLVEAVVVADAFAASGRLDLACFWAYVDAHRRWPGVDQARSALRWASSRSASPGETRLRMIPVLGGLPEPYVNMPILLGQDVVYADLYLVGRRAAAAEYDGGYHETDAQQHADHRRENRIVLGADLQVLRYDRFTVARHAERLRALHELGRAIGVDPPLPLRPQFFHDPRRPLRW